MPLAIERRLTAPSQFVPFMGAVCADCPKIAAGDIAVVQVAMLARYREKQTLPGGAFAAEAQHPARQIVDTDRVSHAKRLERIGTQGRSARPNVAHQHLTDSMFPHGDQFPDLLVTRHRDNVMQ